MRRPGRFLGALVCTVSSAVVLVACSGSSGGTPSAGSTPTYSVAPPAAPATGSPAPPVTPTMPAIRVVYASRTGAAQFLTADRNIACTLAGADGFAVRCEIFEKMWLPPPQASDCAHGTGWGHGLTMKDSVSAVGCFADTLRGRSFPVLAVGHGVRVGSVECANLGPGVQCTDLASHQGFALTGTFYSFF